MNSSPSDEILEANQNRFLTNMVNLVTGLGLLLLVGLILYMSVYGFPDKVSVKGSIESRSEQDVNQSDSAPRAPPTSEAVPGTKKTMYVPGYSFDTTDRYVNRVHNGDVMTL